jgi:hypothetical protein
MALHYLHNKKLNAMGTTLVKWLQYLSQNGVTAKPTMDVAAKEMAMGRDETNVGDKPGSASSSTSGPTSS